MSDAMVAQFLRSHVVPGEESILSIQSNRPDGSLDAVVVDLDPAVGQEELQTTPVFGGRTRTVPADTLRSNEVRTRDRSVDERDGLTVFG